MEYLQNNSLNLKHQVIKNYRIFYIGNLIGLEIITLVF